MPDEDKTFHGSFVLDFEKWQSHMKKKNLLKIAICCLVNFDPKIFMLLNGYSLVVANWVFKLNL